MKIHLVAICGTGMGSLAGLLQEAGHEVRGSDKTFYPPMSERLKAWNIPTMEGFDPDHLVPEPDLVVVGNACRKDNPEARAALDRGLRVMSFPQALSEFFLATKRSIVVAGTHGKTTTSSLLASLLVEAGRDPSYLVGGIPQDYGRSFRLGGGKDFVVEGDEYDSAFFDKRPKFIHYRPDIAVLTSVEFDHADIYEDMDAYRKAFQSLMKLLPEQGTLVAFTDDPEVQALVSLARCRVIPYGFETGPGWRAHGITHGSTGVSFDLTVDGNPAGRISVPLAGRHNVANSLAVLSVADLLGVSLPRSAEKLAGFGGVARRMQVRGEVSGVKVIDDFAHHPTEVKGTVMAARERYPDAFLVAVFEPRTNTSRRKFFQDQYPDSFEGADRVVVVPPFHPEQIPESDRFDSDDLVTQLKQRGHDAVCMESVDQVVRDLGGSLPGGGVILVMSNGAFGNIHERLLAELQARERDNR
jgi:UDP-N-acetylmuramate: L-alanyl-gamma-D-glutamyl-meso-diaminopimelate ligase